MAKKIYRSMLIIIGLSLLLATGLMVSFFYKNLEQVNRQALRESLDREIALYEKYGLEEVGQLKNKRLTLISPQGQVLFDSQTENQDLDNHLNRQEVQEVLDQGDGFSKRYSKTLSEETYYYAKQLKDGNILRISQSTASIFFHLKKMLALVIFLLLVLLALAGISSKKVTQDIFASLTDLDLDQLDRHKVYPEILPFIRKIEGQKLKIEEENRKYLRKKEEFQNLIANMREGLIILNKEGYLISSNRQGEAIFDIVDRQQPFHFQNRQKEMIGAIKQAMEGEKTSLILEKDHRLYQVSLNPIVDEEVLGVFLLAIDQTEKIEGERLRREFLQNISHDVKTPLTTISGVAELLQLKLVKEEDQAAMLERIRKASDRLEDLFSDLLEISVLENLEGPKESLEEVDLEKLIQASLSLYQKKIEEKGLLVKTEVQLSPFLSNEKTLATILNNLIDNAIKYNKDQGELRILAQEQADGLLLEIADTGLGMNLETQARAFERFYRGDKSRSQTIAGTGLGLSIVKHGVNSLQGSIHLESQEGQGTKIRLFLPYLEEEAGGQA